MLQKPVKQTTSWMSALLSLGSFFLGSAILLLVGDGFPPQSWMVLFQTVRYFSLLWSREGHSILMPFLVLVLQSLLLAVSWIALIAFSVGIVIRNLHSGHEPLEMRRDAFEPHHSPSEVLRRPPQLRMEPAIEGAALGGFRPLAFMPSVSVDGNHVTNRKTPPITINLDKLETEYELQEQNHIHPIYAVDESKLRFLRDDEEAYQHTITSTFTLTVGVRSITEATMRLERSEECVFTQGWPSHAASRGLFLIADGKHASREGEELARSLLQTITDDLLPFFLSSTTELQLENVFSDAIRHADAVVNTTPPIALAALLIMGTNGYVFERGGCRCYYFHHAQGLTSLTAKPPEQAFLLTDAFPDLQVISPNDDTDKIAVASLEAGDMLVCCSDGVWNILPEEEIMDVVSRQRDDAALTAHALLEGVASRGGFDTASVIVTLLAPETGIPPA